MNIPPKALNAATAAIAAAIAAREVSDHGLGEPVPGKSCTYRTGVPVSNPRFNPAEVATALLYLRAGPVKVLSKVSSRARSSYGWKHDTERWGELVGLSPYVSNGAFIVAADWLRVPSRRYLNSPNIDYALKVTRADDEDLLSIIYRSRCAS